MSSGLGITFATLHFASGLHQTVSFKLYHMKFSATRTLKPKIVLISILVSSDSFLQEEVRGLANFFGLKDYLLFISYCGHV